jgi:hypothetical protein
MTPPTGSSAARIDIRAWPATVDPQVVDALRDLLDLMIAAWAEPDQQGRIAVLKQCLAPTVTYTTPLAAADGIDGVATVIGQVRAQFPGAVPVRTTGVDLHHRHALYGWVMSNGTQGNPVRGLNVITLNDVPLIQTVTTFLGPLPRITYTYGPPD